MPSEDFFAPLFVSFDTAVRMSTAYFESKKHVELYSKYRLSTPAAFIDQLATLMSGYLPRSRWRLAIDVGCGSGQSTPLWSPYFSKVYGFDISEAQIRKAKELNPNRNGIFYSVGSETWPQFPDASVQLVTATQAAHWFKLPEFFAEANRVLVPKGCVAIVGQLYPKIILQQDAVNSDKLNNLVDSFVHPPSDSPLFAFYEPKMELQRNRFRDVPTPSTFNRLPTQSFFETSTSTLESIVGRMKSSSRYQRFLKEKPEEAAKMIEDIESEMKTIVAEADLAKVVIENRIEYFAVVLVKKS